MNNSQKSIITGSLLGDGYLTSLKKHPTWNWRFGKKQSTVDNEGVDKKDYLLYHLDCLTAFGGNIYPYSEKPKKIGNNTHVTSSTTGYSYMSRVHQKFTQLGREWYKVSDSGKKTKILPTNLDLTPLAICIWYMDDGSKEGGQNRCRIATNNFSFDEVERLSNLLLSDFQINARVILSKLEQPMLEISGYRNYGKLHGLISPLIKWDCFTYKITPPKPVIVLSGENHPCSKLSQVDIDRASNLHDQGVTQKDIAQLLGVKPNTINSAIKGKSWKASGHHNSYGCKGSRNPNAKLSTSQVVEIKDLKGSMSYSKIAYRYDVSKTTISHIMNGKTWA